MRITEYKGTCKNCGWIYGLSNSPNIVNMPSKCQKCSSDMSVQPVFNEDGKGLTFEISIFCKENGNTIRSSFIITEKILKTLSQDNIENMFQDEAAECFLKLICASKNSTDNKNIKTIIFG